MLEVQHGPRDEHLFAQNEAQDRVECLTAMLPESWLPSENSDFQTRPPSQGTSAQVMARHLMQTLSARP